jgi:hypothetical protein
MIAAKNIRDGKILRFTDKLFLGIPNPDLRLGIIGATLAGTLFSSVLLTQFPGLPTSDPQRRYGSGDNLPRWSDARGAIARVKELLPAGASVTAGPRLATMIVGRNDIHFDFSIDKLQEYVLIENFFDFYFPEDKISRELLASPYWELLHQEFVDQRSIQLFRRSETIVKKAPAVIPVSDEMWERSGGALIPLPQPDIEMRGFAAAPGKLQLAARIKEKRDSDVAFKISLDFSDGSKSEFFNSFGNGRWPADLAQPGDASIFIIEYPPDKELVSCKVDLFNI